MDTENITPEESETGSVTGSETESVTETGIDSGSEPLSVPDDWYRNFYEIFVYSFYDSNGDGYGDIKGVISRLDYIKDMGYNAIWLMPVHPSPSYHKYDVRDYYDIDPKYGNVDDMKKLFEEAHKRDIRVIMDLVVNHTSKEHKWFIDACRQIRENGEPSGEHSDYYNFRDTPEYGYAQVTGAQWFYEARFDSGMPDLNLDNPKVRNEIKDIMQFWFDTGADGFRLDAVTSYYTGNIGKNVEFLNWLETTAHSIKEDSFLVGEAWESSDAIIRRYYESGLDSFFIFTMATGEGTIVNRAMSFSAQTNGSALTKLMLNLEQTYDTGIMSCFLGNHDTARAANFLRRSMPERVKMGAGILAMMPGAVFTYYGEEIGMIGTGADPNKRIAMLWDGLDTEGYVKNAPSGADTVTADSYCFPGVASQQEEADSILNYYKQAMKLRLQNPEIARGTVEDLQDMDGIEAGGQVSITRRTWNGSSVIVVINLNSGEPETIKLDLNVTGNVKKKGCLSAYYGVSAGAGEDGTAAADEEKEVYVLPPYSVTIFR
ncbi:MAG: hypothetical protein K6G81_10610 [Lachnospiraceae bacterium]|nr:hypothetical protein [Lachnospiraceae bacterium]